MADIFREVDEELRRDNFAKLWNKYGNHVASIAALLVIATAAFVGWQRYTESQQRQRGEQYAAAVAGLGQADAAQARDALAALSDGGDGYAALARLQQANAAARSGDGPGALARYESLADDGGVEPAYRNLAVILLALHSLDGGDPAALTARLEPLTAADSPWRFSALELTGLLATRAGDTARAREIFAGLADDPTAPPALRGRAAELLATLPG